MKTYVLAVCGALALLGSALIVAKPWVTIRHTQPIVVKGYAESVVIADSATLTAAVSFNDENNADAYTMAGETLEKVKKIVASILKADHELVELQTSVEEVIKLDEGGKKTNAIDFFTVTRRVRISSANVNAMEELGRALFDLNAQGVRIDVTGPDFFVSDIDQAKLELVKLATLNGKERATLMAESSGEALGSLVSARQGVIQITKKNSSETSDWGIYDTETIEKVVKMVVTLEYEIKQ
ncbi:MAG: SIMPL domain-containing protein [Kiritimatiellae bacterium]|nr:SIMPL domain-containing protein [Kiritimatiellia bacterium]